MPNWPGLRIPLRVWAGSALGPEEPGWRCIRLTPWEAAAKEAFEEAGICGTIIGKRPVGNYHYSKRLSVDRDILCEVSVFLFRVEQQLDDWPEKGQRDRRWFKPSEAYGLVDEGGLAEILRLKLGA